MKILTVGRKRKLRGVSPGIQLWGTPVSKGKANPRSESLHPPNPKATGISRTGAAPRNPPARVAPDPPGWEA